ncbi:MFS transporter [Aneurinibacillus terranovensis]|uniref:MFS transporter n=1 Tax=Aneurinibacillus terranovensis TaxID=278991 RepID=UPI000417A856|nr:MFS transporter [Aneurinibacillus terranovensis]
MAQSQIVQINELQKRWWILAGASIGTFMAALDGSIINVALPSISDSLLASLQVVQWVIIAYLLTICSVLPIVWKLSDAFGRYLLYNVGLIAFTVSSRLCGLSSSVSVLIAMRIIQGIGAALLVGGNYVIIASIFPGYERGRAIGIIGAMISLGFVTGPALGGFVAGSYGWNCIFLLNVPLGIFGWITGFFIFPKEKIGTRVKTFDYKGPLLYIVGLHSFFYTLAHLEMWGWKSISTLVGFSLSVFSFVLFYLKKFHTSIPLLDFSLYRIQLFRIGTITGFLSFAALFCSNVLLPFYMQEVLHLTPAVIGYTMMAYPLTMVIMARLSGWLSDRAGSFFLINLGLMVNTLGFVQLATLPVTASSWLIAFHLAFFGIGYGMFQSTNHANVIDSVPKKQLGAAAGMNALVTNLGMLLGISVSISLFSTRLHRLTHQSAPLPVEGTQHPLAFVSALHTVCWVAAGISITALFFSSKNLQKCNV